VSVDYWVYLRSAEWAEFRRGVLDRAGGRCQVCNAAVPLQVHHRTYERLGAELPEDVLALCDSCHVLFSRAGRLVAIPARALARSRLAERYLIADGWDMLAGGLCGVGLSALAAWLATWGR